MKRGKEINNPSALELFPPEGKKRILAFFTMALDMISGGKNLLEEGEL